MAAELEPNDLSTDEIEYEICIRGLTLVNNRRNNCITLKKAFREESEGARPLPEFPEHKLDYRDELDAVTEKIEDVLQMIQDIGGTKDLLLIRQLYSRSEHLVNRFNRIKENKVDAGFFNEAKEQLGKLIDRMRRVGERVINESSEQPGTSQPGISQPRLSGTPANRPLNSTALSTPKGSGNFVRGTQAQGTAGSHTASLVGNTSPIGPIAAQRVKSYIRGCQTARIETVQHVQVQTTHPAQKTVQPAPIIRQNTNYVPQYAPNSHHPNFHSSQYGQTLLTQQKAHEQNRPTTAPYAPPNYSQNFGPAHPWQPNSAPYHNTHVGSQSQFQPGSQTQYYQPQSPSGNLARRSAVFKWRIAFSGDNTGLSLNDFLLQAEDLRIAAGMNETDLRESLIHLLRGSALTWYRAFHAQYGTWQSLKFAMRKEFLPYDYEYYLRKDIDQRFQGDNESFSVFLASMEMLFKNLSKPPPEEEKIEILRRNMKPELARQLSIYHVYSVQQLYNLIKHWERCQFVTDRRRDTAPLEPAFFNSTTTNSNRPRTVRRVQLVEISGDEEEIDAEVAALQRGSSKIRVTKKDAASFQPKVSVVTPVIQPSGGRGPSNVVCWNCEGVGHTFRECTANRERIFCFGCGEKDVTTVNCNKCRFRGNGIGAGQ
jgi:Retrotransposon gag protein